MSKRKVVILCLIVALISMALSITLARYQADKHNPFLVHWRLEQEDYNYCPYCGELLEHE